MKVREFKAAVAALPPEIDDVDVSVVYDCFWLHPVTGIVLSDHKGEPVVIVETDY